MVALCSCSVSVELVRACLRTARKLRHDNHRHSRIELVSLSLLLSPRSITAHILYHPLHCLLSLSVSCLLYTRVYTYAIWKRLRHKPVVYISLGIVNHHGVAASHNSDEHPKEYTSTSCSSLLPSPSQAVSTLISRLPSRQASLSASAFERVLTACADSLQLRTAYLTFSCMTHTHRVAPSRLGLQALGRLLCAPSLTADPHWRRFRLAFTSRILDGQ